MSNPVRSAHLPSAEVSWFAPICNGDDRFLGKRDPFYKSSFRNASQIARTADELGYRNMLLPSSYQVGQDTLTFAAALAPQLRQMNLLTAIRCGEVHPPMLARALATLDHMLLGKLTVNIISSDLPGTKVESAVRYRKSREVIEILKQCWTKDHLSFRGEFYDLDLPTAPVRPYQQNGGPLLYFGGYSPDGVELCAEHCDVYLMWPETEDKIQAHMQKVGAAAGAKFGRTLDFGLRVHVIVRETEAEALQASRDLMHLIDDESGEELKNRALDAKSYGVSKQAALREQSDKDGFVEDHLWTGIGRARSGCGAAIVGTPDQVYDKLMRYHAMGIRSFILSGYPHLEECELFARYVLPRMKTCSLPEELGRRPAMVPDSPLGGGTRL
ncbi:LLM class flavin-dependent oxidoreductase [Neolewinella agarilytica]|uniref:Alkanesulfonate monooxygenase n=1 Tax=Neolewinella agarilytica TaxID=478744 RepID=A0A1H9JUP2_9BACT|nr:LLM class flavin-dependent oxidoreductase [Neolewinella agarilytica]SEQ90636.1 alkanesulfonate monooxygenase [Neolewinella agarilytica]